MLVFPFDAICDAYIHSPSDAFLDNRRERYVLPAILFTVCSQTSIAPDHPGNTNILINHL